MTRPEQIIAACTRCGVTSWQNVARQLGRSVDSVRAQFDPGYERAYVWAPSREPIPPANPEDLVVDFPDENDTSSPHAKGPGLKVEILCLLQHHGAMSVETIATLLHRTRNSVRMRLSQLKAAGLAENDGAGRSNGGLYEWSWSITEDGKGEAVTRCAGRAKERA